MLKRFALALVLAAGLTVPRSAPGQLVAGGAGPVFPIGDFNQQFDPGTGFMLSGRLNLGLFPLIQLQLEATTVQGWELGDPTDYVITTGGVNLAVHFVRVASVRPYALGGLLIARQNEAVDDDGAWSWGYQIGGGLDLKVGPLKPFAEVRLVSVDAPGSIRHTYVPLLFGIKLL
jgi:hypothetical protein